MAPHLEPLSRGTLKTAPTVCHECVWWQTPGHRPPTKERWIERAEDEWGAWGTVYYDDDGRVLGSMQYGPAGLFPRADTLPSGPPSEDAVLITCAYLIDPGAPWVMQSLFLAAMGEARERDAKALETFGYRYGDGEAFDERFIAHKTIFPVDFLSDFGFMPLRSAGRVELMRLELRGLIKAEEAAPAKVLRALKDVLSPAPPPPVPAPRP